MREKAKKIEWGIHHGNGIIKEGALVGIINNPSDKWAAFVKSETAVGIITGQQGKYTLIENGSPHAIIEEYYHGNSGEEAASKAVQDYNAILKYLKKAGYIR